MKSSFILPFAMSLVLAGATAGASWAIDAKTCKSNAQSCAKTCETQAKRLSKKKGNAALAKQIKDCAKACRTYAASGKDKDSCMAACKACAEACEKSGDASLKDCAKQCASCGDCCSK
jgi:hypothetical protein